eukprot:6181828-Pleurochrysis_carterae.AAC.4
MSKLYKYPSCRWRWNLLSTSASFIYRSLAFAARLAFLCSSLFIPLFYFKEAYYSTHKYGMVWY